jgi:hypothetical protein
MSKYSFLNNLHEGVICTFRKIVLLWAIALMFYSCQKESESGKASVILKTGVNYTADGAVISPGGTIKIGILASGAESPLTYLRIERITGSDTSVQLDRGIYAGREGFDQDFSFPKGNSETETWRVFVMNSSRSTASASFQVIKGQGVNYGQIHHFGPLLIGMQNNTETGNYLDLDQGQVYNLAETAGKEQEIDLVPYFYFTSGLPSPTFTCPGYTSAVGYYPAMVNWPQKNTTLFDYYTSDNQLVSPVQFDAALNDSLLITAYNPSRVSGNCKYAYAGRVIPFKTQSGKYGMIKVIKADESESGTIQLEIKIQQ